MKIELDNSIIADVRAVYQQQRALAEGALAQVNDEQFFQTPNAGANSLAIIVKHVGGNLLSRWTDFMRSDGEKPDRNRDGEFVVDSDTRSSIMETWQTGWSALDVSLATLTTLDMGKAVTIRGTSYSVSRALFLNLAHTSHHCGQIVQLAKQLAGTGWETLSIPRPGAPKSAHNFWK